MTTPPIKSIRFTKFHALGIYNSDRFAVEPGKLEATMQGPLLVLRVRRKVEDKDVWSTTSIPLSGGGIAEIVHDDVPVDAVEQDTVAIQQAANATGMSQQEALTPPAQAAPRRGRPKKEA